MKFLDLFAGIGGFRLGLEQAGHTCVGFVEIDKFARKSYEAIFDTEGEYTEHDINKVNTKELPEADIWCFGFPCQDISVAGKQKGFEGNRSSLFFAVTRKLHELEDKKKPSYLLIENVKNLLSINSGWDFASLQIELDSLGYDIEWDVLNSKEVVPQNRERVFIIGHLRGRRTQQIFPIIRQNGEANNTVKQVGNLTPDGSFSGNPQVGRVYGTDGISPTLSTMQGGGQEPKVTIREATKIGYDVAQLGDSINFSQPNSKTRRGRVGHGVANTLTTGIEQATLTGNLRIRKLTPLETWRLQGFPDWAFNLAREAGLSDSQLYKQAGNSVTVPVIKAIADRMDYNNRERRGD
ncbi:DNA cytosine methyltransferase [Companilactobacillus baiquanensis]|uniref:DNA (cytosine-5-)-methyltransferase n=1 Tax=Companilactobacillus baiquanensis TaxID=2486005 RepID=A0ABW1UYN5_9LACO|nr:DNA cytosine methyltransferase [Companilactobacillus baiquanensis]